MITNATPPVVASTRRRVSAVFGIVAVVTLLLLGACSSTSTHDTDQRSTTSSSQPAPSEGIDETTNDAPSVKYTQTWAAAADILTSGRNKIDGGSGLPPESLITSFRDDISEGCTADVPGLIITDVSYGVYTIGHDRYGP